MAPQQNVSYSYASADHTFEIDMSAPAASFSVTDEKEITNNSPFIKVFFDDAEYPGDSYTDVELTAATLTMGDDETDIAADFAAEANGHNYLWAGVGLALGEYTLAVTGTDDRGQRDGRLADLHGYREAVNTGRSHAWREPDLAAWHACHEFGRRCVRWL